MHLALNGLNKEVIHHFLSHSIGQSWSHGPNLATSSLENAISICAQEVQSGLESKQPICSILSQHSQLPDTKKGISLL